MKRSRFTEEQVIAILREQEAGSTTADVYRNAAPRRSDPVRVARNADERASRPQSPAPPSLISGSSASIPLKTAMAGSVAPLLKGVGSKPRGAHVDGTRGNDPSASQSLLCRASACSQSNDINAWLTWLADIVIEAQARTITRIRFLIDKTHCSAVRPGQQGFRRRVGARDVLAMSMAETKLWAQRW